ncbi:hypothetical protein JCM17960_11070 [Magnetospira thiophila]
MPQQSKNLSDAQIDNIYRIEYFDRPQIAKLAQVPGLQQAAPQLAEHVFEAGVLHGPEDAGKWLQQSIDEVMSTDLRVTDRNGNKVYDGIIGSGTRRMVEQAVKAGKIKEINNRIVSKRLAYMKTLPEFKFNNKGWSTRAQTFLMP